MGYKKSGIRNFYSGIDSNSRYFPNRNERSFIFDNHSLLGFMNLCDHSPDHYCRQAYYLLQRNRALVTRQNVPNPPGNPGTNSGNC